MKIETRERLVKKYPNRWWEIHAKLLRYDKADDESFINLHYLDE